MPVAVAQVAPVPKKDPLETIARALQIAGSVYGIKEASAKLDQMQREEDSKNAIAQGKIDPGTNVALVEKGLSRAPVGTPGAQGDYTDTITGEHFALLPKSDFKPPVRQEYRDQNSGKNFIGVVDQKTGLVQMDTNKDPLAPNQPKDDSALSEYQKQMLDLDRQRLAMQKSEKDKKDNLDYDQRLKALPIGDKQRFDNVRMYAKGIDDMEKAIVNGSSRYSLIGDNDFTKAFNRAAEAYGRMQSGGAINKQEEENFKNSFRALGDNVDTTLSKLADSRNEANARFETLGFKPEEVPDIIQSRADLAKAIANKKQPTGTAFAGSIPKVGEVQDGWEFLGGNPADPKQWKKK